MLDLKDFSFDNTQTIFDVKGFLFKVLSYWKLILLSIACCMFVAYQINIRKQKIYSVSSLVVIKNENSPLSSTSSNIVFNWGAANSEKANILIATLQSRHHNEQVVDYLEYYVDYLKEDKYGFIDVYGSVPFRVEIDKSYPQVLGAKIGIKFVSQSEFILTVEPKESGYQAITYGNKEIVNVGNAISEFSKKYKINDLIDLPYLKIKLKHGDSVDSYVGEQYYFAFNNFNSTVSKYRGINVSLAQKASGNLLTLDMQGTNKARLVEYINTTIKIQKDNQLEEKNIFAVNTIKFIDSTLASIQQQNAKTSSDVKQYLNSKDIYNIIESGEATLTQKLGQYDFEKDAIKRKIQYYNSLKNYLESRTDFSDLPAPTVAGIEDQNVVANVSQLIELSIQRSKSAYGVKNQNSIKQFDSKMEAVKDVLLENINTAKSSLNYDLSLVNSKLGGLESSIRKMPSDKQDYLEIMRKFNLEQEILSNLMQKRNDAQILKASNVSDLQFIDEAKDVGGGLIGPHTQINYVLALFFGILIPIAIILLFFLLDNSIKTTNEISRLTKVPVLGILPQKSDSNENIVVKENTKTAISESFRNLRASLQYVLKHHNTNKANMIMITSSIGGEGKTFCAVNLSSVIALSGKRTALVGLDLRKPRIYGDFKGLNRDIGVVNYLIGDKNLEQITQKSHLENLDIILSGVIPPNPSELIMSQAMKDLIVELHDKYDYVIFDTAPVGLVSDALEIAPYCDATLYMVRQDVTKKPTLAILNNKFKSGELQNTHIILNEFTGKNAYSYGYGYGYGYYDEDVSGNGFLQKIKRRVKR